MGELLFSNLYLLLLNCVNLPLQLGKKFLFFNMALTEINGSNDQALLYFEFQVDITNPLQFSGS